VKFLSHLFNFKRIIAYLLFYLPVNSTGRWLLGNGSRKVWFYHMNKLLVLLMETQLSSLY